MSYIDSLVIERGHVVVIRSDYCLRPGCRIFCAAVARTVRVQVQSPKGVVTDCADRVVRVAGLCACGRAGFRLGEGSSRQPPRVAQGRALG